MTVKISKLKLGDTIVFRGGDIGKVREISSHHEDDRPFEVRFFNITEGYEDLWWYFEDGTRHHQTNTRHDIMKIKRKTMRKLAPSKFLLLKDK